MMFARIFINLSIYLTLAVCVVAVLGDYLTFVCKVPIVRALCDNATHAIIGGLSWFICYVNGNRSSKEWHGYFRDTISCVILSSVIDMDHFIAAKSLFIKDAIKLPNRPFLHCSTVAMVLFPILLSLSYILKQAFLKREALVILTAFSTHHIRDATRRGLWFYPFGHTPPIPYIMYIFLTCLVPYVVIWLDRVFEFEGQREDTLLLDIV